MLPSTRRPQTVSGRTDKLYLRHFIVPLHRPYVLYRCARELALLTIQLLPTRMYLNRRTRNARNVSLSRRRMNRDQRHCGLGFDYPRLTVAGQNGITPTVLTVRTDYCRRTGNTGKTEQTEDRKKSYQHTCNSLWLKVNLSFTGAEPDRPKTRHPPRSPHKPGCPPRARSSARR